MTPPSSTGLPQIDRILELIDNEFRVWYHKRGAPPFVVKGTVITCSGDL